MRKNIYLLNFYHLMSGLWLFSALAIIYFQRITGSYTLAMLAFSLVNLTQSIMEIPCGMFSDRWGRRKTLLISAIIMFFNLLFWAIAGNLNSVFMLMIGSCLRGVSLALLSGTDSAFLYETLSDLRKKSIFDKVYSRTASYHQLGLIISALTATFVTYYGSLLLLVWLSVLPAIIKILIAWQFSS